MLMNWHGWLQKEARKPVLHDDEKFHTYYEDEHKQIIIPHAVDAAAAFRFAVASAPTPAPTPAQALAPPAPQAPAPAPQAPAPAQPPPAPHPPAAPSTTEKRAACTR